MGFGAANRIRTGDLVLTKDVLYRLSHSSIFKMQELLYKGFKCLSRDFIWLPLTRELSNEVRLRERL